MDISNLLKDFKIIVKNKYKNLYKQLSIDDKLYKKFVSSKKIDKFIKHVVKYNPNLFNSVLLAKHNKELAQDNPELNYKINKIGNVVTTYMDKSDKNLNHIKHTDTVLKHLFSKIKTIHNNTKIHKYNIILEGGGNDIEQIRTSCREELMENLQNINKIIRNNELQIKYIDKFVTNILKYHSFLFSSIDLQQYIYYNKNIDEIINEDVQKTYIIDYIINSPVFVNNLSEFETYELQNTNKDIYSRNIVDCAHTSNYEYVQKIYQDTFEKYYENHKIYSINKNEFTSFNTDYIEHVKLIILINQTEYSIKIEKVNKKILENYNNLLKEYKTPTHEFTRRLLIDFITRMLYYIENNTINIYINTNLLKHHYTRQIHYGFILLDFFMNNIYTL